MSEYDADAYMSLWNKIEKQSSHLRSIIEQLEAKKKERYWARHQTAGDLDDGKLIEGITGERNIYRYEKTSTTIRLLSRFLYCTVARA